MSAMVLIYALASTGLFSARAFLPSFLVALALRFGPSLPWIGSLGIFSQLTGAPTWLTHDATLTVLGFLSLLEMAATKVPEARRAFDFIDPYIKTAMVALTTLGVLESTDAEFVSQALAANVGGILATSLPAAAGTLALSSARRGLLRPLLEADEDDALGLQRLFSWTEEFGVLIGVVLLFLVPVLVLTLVAAGTACLLVLLAMVRRREEAKRIECISCKNRIHRGARICHRCLATNGEPRRLGFLGVSTGREADPASHPLDLVERRRCPLCASHHRGSAEEPCQICSASLFGDPDLARRYLARIDGRLPSVLGLCFFLGLVPILGSLPGILLYRIRLVGPLRMWVPPGRSLFLRLGLACVQFLLLAFQWVPLFGALAVPAMAWLAFRTYRPAFVAAVFAEGPSEIVVGAPQLR